jgi:hypothetical protein
MVSKSSYEGVFVQYFYGVDLKLVPEKTLG